MMTATACPSAEQLRDYSLGRLPEPQSDELFDHLRNCETCKSELETVSDKEDSLIASLRSPDALAGLSDEPDCRVAVAKALGALAAVGESPTTADLSFLPENIGEYEVVRPLGRGGMGSVYLARHTKLGREVALKVLATHRLADKRMRERFEAEMRAVGRLSHPNIVTAHDARELDDTAVLVTEYIDGFDLGQLVARTGPLELADACEIVRQVALALQYTSDQGFVHRDVKPSNIMLSSTGEVKLLDLGLARFQPAAGDGIELTGTGQAMGTADYIAPEQVSDSRSVDIRADIYSLGCTLFKLLTGTAPFADDQHPTAFAKMTAHVSSEPPNLGTLRDDAPARLIKFVDSMLKKAPDARPQTPRLVAEKLAAFSSGANLPALAQLAAALEPKPAEANSQRRSSSPSTARTKPFMRRPVPMAAAIGAGFFGLVLGVLMGVLIKIKYPDGTELTVAAPEGSEVTVTPSPGRSAAGSLPVNASRPASSDPFSGPLQFALVVNVNDPFDISLAPAKAQLQKSNSGGLVITGAGIWYPVNENVELPTTETADGQRFALVSREPAERVSWGELRGHIVSGQSSSHGMGGVPHEIHLEFDETLDNRMRELTGNNLNERLAIIIDDRIVSAPTIRSEIGKKAQITGLSPEEARYLIDLIDGGLVEPLRRSADVGADYGMGMEMGMMPMGPRGMPMGSFGGSSYPPSGSADQEIENSLKQIGVAFHNFHDTHDQFPASVNQRVGAGITTGKVFPFSWRVAILPFIEQSELFKQYRFDEPWDSETNKKLLEQMPAIYKNPFAPSDQPEGHTNYQGFVTGDSAIGKDQGVAIREILDGTSNTLLLIETKDSVPWTKPQDIEGEPEFFDDHPVHFLMVDGSVHSRESIDRDELRKLITRAGGEPVRVRR